MNIHQTKAHGLFLQSIGWKVYKHRFDDKDTYYFLKKIPLLPFHFLKIQRISWNLIDWNYIQKLEKKYHVYETVIEIDDIFKTEDQLDSLMIDKGFKAATDFMLTTKTRLINLSLTQKKLMMSMKPKTRYNLHKSMRNELKTSVITLEKVIKTDSLFNEYLNLLKENARRIKMLLIPKTWIYNQWRAFANNGFVVEVRNKTDERLEAMAVFYTSQDTCSYNLNGSTKKGRHEFAPSLAIWVGIIEAKKMGLKWWDFDGIYDERYDSKQKRFKGFGRFKAGFGGQEICFPPMYRKRRWGL